VRPHPPLYHWSPTSRRASIERLGLVPGRAPTVSSPGWRAPYVCLAENPHWAWQLSGALHPDVPAWDLWQVSLGEGHKIHRQRPWGPLDGCRYYEWRVYDRIYKRGVWLVATRGPAVWALP
jgi:hypothetical protein